MELAIGHRAALSKILEVSTEESSEGELAAMVSFAIAFPAGFMALVDTYDVKRYFAFRHNSLGLFQVNGKKHTQSKFNNNQQQQQQRNFIAVHSFSAFFSRFVC